MSESNGKLSRLKGKPAPFTLSDGTKVYLLPITFDERSDLIQWNDENKDTPYRGLLLERKLVALTLCDETGAKLCETPDEAGTLPTMMVDEIAPEAGARCGLYTRPGEKKVTPPDSSEIPTSSSPVTLP